VVKVRDSSGWSSYDFCWNLYLSLVVSIYHWLFTIFSPGDFSAILLAVHLVRITTEPLQRLSDKYVPTGRWKRTIWRPSHTWLRAIEADLGPLNFGLTTAWRKATTRDEWRLIVNTAMLQWSTLLKKKKEVSGIGASNRNYSRALGSLVTGGHVGAVHWGMHAVKRHRLFVSCMMTS